MSPEESASRLESMLYAHAGGDAELLRRSVPLLVVASGARYTELGPELQRFWRTFLVDIGAAESDSAEDISRKVDGYYRENPLPEPILAAVHSTIAAANRDAALEIASRSASTAVRAAPKVEEVSQKRRQLPLRMPKVFR